jgi:NAD(P)H-dependent flavin oxidoreductase YrpB (nitropropane dioxygenase family)
MLRRAKYDYTKGKLAELIEAIIEEKTSLFVCAVGVPPKHAVDRLHEAGIPVSETRASLRRRLS